MSRNVFSQIFYGTVIHSTSLDEITILENALLVVDDYGTIVALEANVQSEKVPERLKALSAFGISFTTLQKGQFIMPGFVDTHNHAPQWLHRGQGQGLQILEWLNQVAFHNESLFKDANHAKRVYRMVVKGMLRQGVTTASYYGSLHGEATKILADVCLEHGQRALVGKCNMARNAPDFYVDASVEESLQVTRDCIHHIQCLDPKGELLRHVLTPRFAICCDESLLTGLGAIAAEHPTMAIQTHFDESEQEKTFTLSLFPQFTNEADLYEYFSLLGPRSILAHCTIMTPYETQRLQDLGCGVAHCPTANMTVGGGFMAARIKDLLRRGVKVGLGTDSGGGYSVSMLNAMRHALVNSFARDFLDARDGTAAVTMEEAFHMATVGGARVVGFGDEVGNFQVGKQFDALLVDVSAARGGITAPLEEVDSLRTMLEKFIMTGDDRNIVQVYVRGRLVHGC
ncbi:Guanine deaminase [Cordyceps fumosorosea ARSEF 2679]|uniref:Probable guanine deaminase n=1 Tax=Cordyceps fumosorosea (strain ARSEF 2679) TaxID=1081104 RepID=A0A167ZE82_CORFA|nr:Guanine deaminase [Cordyceps fumosorosea ARSEF 2679]OAA67403.1 Guanine deaminase [Cordyceps fumosorosea ARSEF 2679]